MQNNPANKTNLAALEVRFRGGIGRRILHFPRISSTMDIAREMLVEAKDTQDLHGIAIIADEQTNGKGRFERTWHSDPGEDILISVILCPRPSISSQLTIMASLSVAMTVDTMTSRKSAIKWPNDVTVDDKKICGVIAESLTVADAFASIVGIGLNINLRNHPDRHTEYDATSIRELLKTEMIVDRAQVLDLLLNNMNELYNALDRGETIMSEWRDKLVTLGAHVDVTMLNRNGKGDIISGFAENVDEFGRLLIRENCNVLRAVTAGEVTTRKRIDGN